MLERHAALAWDDHEERAALAMELGHRIDAVDHARAWLNDARLALRIAEARGESTRAAERELKDAAAFTAKVARRFNDGPLLLRAVTAQGRPKRRDLLAGLEHSRWVDPDIVAMLRPSVEDDVELYLALLPNLRSYGSDPFDPRTIPNAVLRYDDISANDARWRRLEEELKLGTMSQLATELAAINAEHDPTDLRARILLELRAANRAGTFVDDVDLLDDVAREYVALAALARSRRRAETFVDAPAATLHYATVLLRAHLPGDALKVVTDAETRWKTDDQRDLASLIAALAFAANGDEGRYADWRARREGAATLSADRLLTGLEAHRMGWQNPEAAGDDVQAVLLSAARRRLALRDRDLPVQHLIRLSFVDELSRRDHAWLDARLGTTAIRAARCRAEGGSANDCIKRSIQGGETAQTEIGRYGLDGPDADALINHAWYDSLDAASRAVVVESANTTLALSSAFTWVHIGALLTDGRLDEADQVLMRFGSTLEPAALAALQLRVLDERKGIAYESMEAEWLDASWPKDSAYYGDDEATPSLEDDAPWYSRMAAAAQAVFADKPGEAAAIYEALANEAPEPGRSMLLALAARGLLEAGDVPAAWARLSTLAPNHPSRLQVEGHIAAKEGDKAAAERLWLQAWPRSSAVAAPLASLPPATLSGPAAVRLFRDHGSLHYGVAAALVDAPNATLAQLSTWIRAADDPDFAWTVRNDLPGPLVYTALSTARTKLRASPTLADAKPWAAGVLELLAKEPSPRRSEQLEMMLLTGEHERALSLARSDVPEDGLEPLPISDEQVRLHTAALAGSLSPDALFAEWRWRTGLPAKKAHDALLSSPPPGPMVGYACTYLVDTPEDPRALPTCKRAWEAERDVSAQSSVNYSFLLLQQEPPNPADLAAVFAQSPMPLYRPDRSVPADRESLSILHGNHAAWMRVQRDHDGAAKAMVDSVAFAKVFRTYNVEVPEGEYLVRAEQARDLAARHDSGAASAALSRQAYISLLGLDPMLTRYYAAAAAAWGNADTDRDALLSAARADDLAPVLADDRGFERAPDDALHRAAALSFQSHASLTELEGLHDRHPTSALIRLALAEVYVEEGRGTEADTILGPVLSTYPDNPLVAVVGARARFEADDIEGAKRRYADAAATHPDSLTLRFAPLPESVLGAREGLPPWVRTPEAFDAALARITQADLLALSPRYARHTEVGADGFFPLGWTQHEDDPLSAQNDDGAWVVLSSEARASRCVGEACIQPTLEALQRRGLTLHFTRPVQLSVGEAYEATLSDASEVWSVTTVPSGGRVFTLFASSPHGASTGLLPALALLRRSFAPLDSVLPAFRAATLRAAGRPLVDTVRLRARLEAHGTGTGCAAAQTLASMPKASAKDELLLDLYLASPDPQARRRVIACAEPKDRIARRLGVVALLDDDARLHSWGREAVFRHASRALTDAKEVLSSDLEIPLSAIDYFERQEGSVRGRVELGLALPAPVAARWLAPKITGDDERAAVDAWVVASQRPELVSLDDAAAEALEGPPWTAQLAFDVLEHRDRTRYASVLRARFDAVEPERTDETELWFPRSIGYQIAALVDPKDRARLRSASARFDGDSKIRSGLAKSFDGLAEDHARALALLDDPSAATRKDGTALIMASRARTHQAPKPRARASLQSAPLASLLPGRHWSLARVGAVGLFGSTLLDLTRRIAPQDPTQRLLIDRLIESAKTRTGFASLLDGGGLDVSAPVECASQANERGFVCVATVDDADTLLSGLGKREFGSDAGLSIPLQASRSAWLLPAGFSAMPAILHEILYEQPDDENDDEPKRDPPKHRYERLRHTVEIAGYTLHYYAIIDDRGSSVGIDAERYLFLGDRVLVFSNDLVARQILFASQGPVLSDDDEYKALTRDWKDGSALQAAAFGLGSPIDGASVASEVVADGQGLAFRYSATTDAELSDMRAAAARLPEDAVSTLVVGYPEQDQEDLPELRDVSLAEGDVLPPIELLHLAKGAAFGWYPAPGDSLWKRWVLVLEDGRGLARKANALGAKRAGASPKQSKAGWYYAKVGSQWIVASDAKLAQASLDRPGPSKAALQLLARGTFSGERAAAVVPRLPSTNPTTERTMLRFFGGVLGLVTSVGFEATWDPATTLGTLEGRVSLTLRDAEGSDVIDQWLAAARFRNAATLPRSIGPDEAEGTLRFRLEVGDAEAFAALTVQPSARVNAIVRDPTHVDLIVRAKATDDAAAEPLTESRRKALLDTSSSLRIRDPAVVAVRDSLVRKDMSNTEKAKAISRWVHRSVNYEITPRALDAVEILDAGRGDCSEYAQLTVSLLRSAGVPAEVRDGMAAQAGEMVAHAWVAYHDGTRWYEIDPTWGRMKVTAGHLPLEVMDVLALISLDQMRIETIDTPPK